MGTLFRAMARASRSVAIVWSAMWLAVASASEPLRSVLVIRHCLRSTPTTTYGAKGLDDFSNYSSDPFPGWPVPAYQCLPDSLQLIRDVGHGLGPTLPGEIDVRVDTSAQRDVYTAKSLLQGLGRSAAYT